MKPYYEDTTNGITIYHGDCREIDTWDTPALVVTDPPYGIQGSEHVRATSRRSRRD